MGAARLAAETGLAVCRHGRMSRRHRNIDRRAWELVRVQVFNRDKWRCRKCGKAGRLECDHIQPLNEGGDPLDPGNLQSLCRDCHFRKTGRENERISPERQEWRDYVRDLANR